MEVGCQAAISTTYCGLFTFRRHNMCRNFSLGKSKKTRKRESPVNEDSRCGGRRSARILRFQAGRPAIFRSVTSQRYVGILARSEASHQADPPPGRRLQTIRPQSELGPSSMGWTRFSCLHCVAQESRRDPGPCLARGAATDLVRQDSVSVRHHRHALFPAARRFSGSRSDLDAKQGFSASRNNYRNHHPPGSNRHLLRIHVQPQHYPGKHFVPGEPAGN